MNDFFRESLFAGVTLSLLSYFIGSVLKKKFKLGIFNPLLISIIITIIVLAVSGVDELFIGLNDLHISMGLTFMFELLSDGLVEYIAAKCNKANMPFGFGGIARIGEGDLPSDYILGEHVRLGSTSVILSRTFKGVVDVDKNICKINLAKEVAKVRKRMQEIDLWSDCQHTENRERIVDAVDIVVGKISAKN